MLKNRKEISHSVISPSDYTHACQLTSGSIDIIIKNEPRMKFAEFKGDKQLTEWLEDIAEEVYISDLIFGTYGLLQNEKE